jgi:hypothetical protein
VGLEALNGAVSEAAWRTKPSWYLVATDDKMIPPPAQRFMSKRASSTVVEVAGSHTIYVSQTLQKHPDFALMFALTYPHRNTVAPAKALDDSFGSK